MVYICQSYHKNENGYSLFGTCCRVPVVFCSVRETCTRKTFARNHCKKPCQTCKFLVQVDLCKILVQRFLTTLLALAKVYCSSHFCWRSWIRCICRLRVKKCRAKWGEVCQSFKS